MRIFGKHILPRQILLVASGLLFFGATTYDVHRSIKNNETPPSPDQIKAFREYLDAKRRPPPSLLKNNLINFMSNIMKKHLGPKRHKVLKFL